MHYFVPFYRLQNANYSHLTIVAIIFENDNKSNDDFEKETNQKIIMNVAPHLLL